MASGPARGIMKCDRQMGTIDALTTGRAAFARQAWRQAYSELSAADRIFPLDIEDLERLAACAWLIGLDDISADLWARAHSECVRQHDIPRAARCTFWLVADLLTRGQVSRANGWLARAHRLLDDDGCECAARGLLLVLGARGYIRQGQLPAAIRAVDEAVELARRFPDPELQTFTRLIQAQLCAKRGDVSSASSLFDEIMVAVTVGDASPIAVGIVYCAVIEACYGLFDLGRAREWTVALSRWCSEQPDLVPFRGQCLVHRLQLLRFSGAWSQALEEAEQACSWMEQAALRDTAADPRPASSFKYPRGPAFYQIAEIHRLRGEFEKAEAAYQQASMHGYAPEPGLALLRMARGRHQAADAAIRRALQETQSRPKRAEMLAACVDIMIAASDLDTARAAEEELRALAASCSTPFLHSLSSQATGRVLVAEGDARAALNLLRAAWMGWQELEAPWEAARVRVLLALACRALGDEDTAGLELDAALRVFNRLGSAPDAVYVTTLRGARDGTGAGILTSRELQIIALLATGKTNRVIAEELSISERTVDRHVSNILSKLDLTSRTAATAYAYEHKLL